MSDGLNHTQKDRALELIGELAHSLTKRSIDELDELVAATQPGAIRARVLPNDGSIDKYLWPILAEIVRTAEKLKHDIQRVRGPTASEDRSRF